MFQSVNITHDGFRQIGQVPFSEIPQREFPKALCQTETCGLYLAVHQTIGRFILLNMRRKGKYQECQDEQHVHQGIWQWDTVCQGIHKVLHHAVQNAHPAHDDKIHRDRPESPFSGVPESLITECITTLKGFTKHHFASSPAEIFH